MMGRARLGAIAIALAPILLVSMLIGVVLLTSEDEPAGGACGAGPGLTVDPAALPADAVAGYSGQQLVNAALVINAGQALGLDTRAQTIGVMTAMGESSLLVLDRGDVAGPDSRGLFQQRDNGAWGTYADRMDPTTSATNFFTALAAVPGWATLSPTLAAHRVQRNADPFHYVPYWDPAVAVVTALAGVPVTGIAPGAGDLACTNPAPAGAITVDGWTKPTIGPVTSGFGIRWGRPHNGTDIAPPCDAPIYAAAAGIVVRAGPSTGYGNLIAIDHGGGTVTRYAHMYPDDLLVAVGDQVPAGTQIARVGSYGDSTGCHLHFEIQLNGVFTDPQPYLQRQGVFF
jgi:murein DD-endopeptidase MepM/ murein hydrolase activator NlpD